MNEQAVVEQVVANKPLIEGFITGAALFAKELLLPSLVFLFILGAALRVLIFYTVKRSEWFAKELDKRINTFIESERPKSGLSFYVLMKELLERTYYELFEVRGIMRRRKLDYVMAPSDRFFMIQAGAAFLVKHSLKQIRFLRYGEERPKFLAISKAVFQNNPCFNRIFAVVPAAPVNEMINILPGLLIIGGIFGTFLGIMKALPELGGMNLSDAEGTKLVMDTFLLRISFSMGASVTGIFLSVMLTTLNAFMSPERVFASVVNRFELALELLWQACDNNQLPENLPKFDENRDPIAALAEYAVQQELAKQEKLEDDGSRPKGTVETKPKKEDAA